MADIFRGPLLSRFHRKPVAASAIIAGANLLLTTLAPAAALPFNNASAFPAQVAHPSHRLSVNADTSRGMPKALFADAVAPNFDAPGFAQQHPRSIRSNANTSTGTPLTLFPAAAVAAPFQNLPSAQPDSREVRSVGSDVQANLQLFFAPDLIASGIPEGLAIYRKPVTPTNTSFRAGVLLDVTIPAAPFVNAPIWSPPRVKWLPADTTCDTPKTLFADATVPAFNPPQMLAHWKRPQTDTSKSSPRQLLDVVVAPFVNLPILTPDRKRPVYDTSRGTPKTLTADAVVPFFVAPTLQVDRRRPVVDTSSGLNIPLSQFVAAPPTIFNEFTPPIDHRRRTEFQAPSFARVDSIPPSAFTTATIYLPLRFGSGTFLQVGIVAANDLQNLRSFLPHSRQPIMNADGTMNNAWYRFFQVFVDVFLGGSGAYTLADIISAVTSSQELTAALTSTTAAIAQQSQTNAEALSAVVQVTQDSALPGSDQIPPVQLTYQDFP